MRSLLRADAQGWHLVQNPTPRSTTFHAELETSPSYFRFLFSSTMQMGYSSLIPPSGMAAKTRFMHRTCWPAEFYGSQYLPFTHILYTYYLKPAYLKYDDGWSLFPRRLSPV